MSVQERYDILLIDPDSASRNKLKQVAMALTCFKKVHTVGALNEGLAKCGGGENIDCIALSYRFDQEDITNWIGKAKETGQGEDCAYITVLPAKDQGNEAVAKNVISGFDGFLFEPYSAENLREIAEIAARVKHQNGLNRKKAAFKMLLKDVMEHIDACAFYHMKERNAERVMAKLEEAVKQVRSLQGDVLGAYLEVCSEEFPKRTPPVTASYSGVSDRVRQRMEAKMEKELEEKYEAA